MNASWWNGEPGALPTDPEWDRLHEREESPVPCFDCGADAKVSTITHEGEGRSYCKSCAQQRDREGRLCDSARRTMAKGARCFEAVA